MVLILFWFSRTTVFSSGIMRDISSMALVSDMGPGWNLGNTLDASSRTATGLETETAWGAPKTTKAMFDVIKNVGFTTIRVPVTWNGHFGEGPEYTVDPIWLDRVEEVVNYALDGKTYVIINSHHDGWVTLTDESKVEVKDKISKIWAQVAHRFKDYSDYLLFESLNEPRLYGHPEEWTGGNVDAWKILNEYNAAIIAAIRSTGGNNVLRNIIIPTYAASTFPLTQEALKVPAGETKIIVSQHIYFPYAFAMDVSESSSTAMWGTEKDKDDLLDEILGLEFSFLDRGLPVIIGEWGNINKDNQEARIAHAQFFVEEARKRNIPTIWWDNSNARVGRESFGIFDRKNLTWSNSEISDAIIIGWYGKLSIKSAGKFQSGNSRNVFAPYLPSQFLSQPMVNILGKQITYMGRSRVILNASGSRLPAGFYIRCCSAESSSQ